MPAHGETVIVTIESSIGIRGSRDLGIIDLISLFPISMMRQLLDIVNQAVEIPLREQWLHPFRQKKCLR